MDMIAKVGKVLLKLTWGVIKLALRVIQVASDVSDEGRRKQRSIYGSLEAHELYDKGEITLDQFLIATRPK